MAMMRLFLIAAAFLAIVGCFKKEKVPDDRIVTPRPLVEQDKAADALFEEFFDNSSSSVGEPAAQSQKRTTSLAVSTPSSASFTFSPNGRYVAQVSTVVSVDLANSIARKFEKMGYPAYVAQVENPTTSLIGTYYRVRIGGFSTIGDAKNFGEEALRPLGYDYWVDNRSNDNIGIGGMGLGSYQQAVNYDAAPPTSQPAFEVEHTPPPVPSNDNNWDNLGW